MITTGLIGGLGNQLFKIFAAMAYAMEYHHDFLFLYSKTLVAGTERPTYWDNFLKSLRKYTTPDPNVFNEYLRIYNMDHHYVPLPVPEPTKNYLIAGYCQSPKYFEEYKEKIFEMIQIRKHINNVREDYSQYFGDGSTYLIAMHFRIGDYKHLQHSHNLLTHAYYEEALQYVMNAKKGENPTTVLYFVEKDDVSVAEETIRRLKERHPQIHFQLVDTSIPDWKQMLLISCCHSIIIANSTFSWWGAYFAPSPEVVCYPDHWFGPRLQYNNTNDMFLPSWVRIYAD